MSDIGFEGQRPNEEILEIYRQHPWVMSRSAVLAIGILLVAFLPLLLPGGGKGIKLIIIGAVIALIILAVRLYIWWNTIYVLTDQRIIGSVQHKLLMRKVDEVPIGNIQNISHIKKGLWSMLFDYGIVQIQTSGSVLAMELDNIENPLTVQQAIIDVSYGKSTTAKAD